MRQPDKRRNDDDVLHLVAAVADVHCWLYDPRPYESQHRRSWESALADFQAAADLAGPNLCAALGGDLTTARTVVAGLPDSNTIGLSGANPDPGRAAAQAAVAGLRARWTDSAVLEAAWVDILDACRDAMTPYDVIAARRDLFWQLVRAADRNTRNLSSQLDGVLNDSALYIQAARVQLGDNSAPAPGAWPRPDDAAGLSDVDRLDLCRRLVTSSPTFGHHVVWVAFDRASLIKPETVGPIAFYPGKWVRQSLEYRSDFDQLPDELTNPDSRFSYEQLPDGDRIVLARVDLGNGAISDAPRLAEEQAQAVVAVASFHVGERYWQLRKGYVHAVDDRVTAWSSFSKRLDPRDYASGDRSKATARALPKLASSLGPRLPSDPAITEAVEALRWWQDATEQPPLAAIVLHVRVLELIASRATANTAWYDFLASHFATTWVRHKVFETLLKAVIDAVEYYQYYQVAPSEHGELESLKSKVLGLASGKPDAYHLDEALAAVPILAGIYPLHDDLGRRVHTLADRLSSTAKLDAWCEGLQERWSYALARLRRVRNTLAHGGPITPSCADTIDRLAERLAAWALAATLEGVLDGRGIVTAYDNLRQEADAWRAGVANAASVHDALFPP